MNQHVIRLVKGIKKSVLCGFFLLLFYSFSSSTYAIAQDGNLLLADSVVSKSIEHDSLSRQFLFPGQYMSSNPLLDSIRSKVVVEGNDFMSWITFSNSLRQDLRAGSEVEEFKLSRPIWVIIVLALLLVGLGLIRIFFMPIFRNIVLAYYDKQVLSNMNKEDGLTTSWPYIFLFVIFSISLSLFLLIVESEFTNFSVLNVGRLFQLTGVIALLFAGKILLIKFFSYIFEIDRVVREYVLLIHLVYFNSMLILMPFLLFVTLLPMAYFNFLLILFAIIVSSLFLYRFFVVAVHLLGQLKFSIFYLILYLCSLEIAPILILVRTLSN